jgi:hypothetical protein
MPADIEEISGRGAAGAGVWFGQEYLCEFMDNGMAMFGRDLVEAALDSSAGAFEFGGLWT